MVIYYDSSTKKAGVVERNSEIYINGFKSDEVLFEILKSIGCGDLMFNPNNNVIMFMTTITLMMM